ncbi:response regulator [Pseudoduganella namucuonensis]|uniref:Two component transcriptional regulator, LuxR family n=1 Tax=Pseudoduganella namucuonensis TaxID=1035707 RepID=A0A1I7IML1_9BURK|nr:response regulator transcription factor [Pseudoduganella namucuonensis]SFU74170.1 two component transcriptional regulator, LuxR family [Pseudoduganella namucuonensis]
MDTGTARIRLLLLDSHEVVRTALRHLLEARGYDIVGACGNLEQGLALAQRLKPDIVLMESQFPSGDAVRACRHIRAASPCTRVVFLTSLKDDTMRVDGIMAGADGYLHKGAKVEELARTITAVARGTPAIDADTIQILRDKSSAAGRAAAPGADTAEIAELTPQERKILPLIAEGLTNKQIGDALGLSHKTVKNHLSSVFQKLQVTRRAQLAAIVARRA